MRVEMIYDQGSAKHAEDCAIICPPFFGVLDGVSEPYHPAKGQKLYEINGRLLTGGQMVCWYIADAVHSAKRQDKLDEIMKKARASVKETLKKKRIDPDCADRTPAAVFAIAKITDNKIELIQGGDCSIVIANKHDSVFSTKNQMLETTKKIEKYIARLIIKCDYDMGKVWKHLIQHIRKTRKMLCNQSTPGGYCAINGQENSEKLWFYEGKEVHLEDFLKTMILFTDGFVFMPAVKNEHKLAKSILEAYSEGGLKRILECTRRMEERKKWERHILHAEATAIALSF